MAPESSCIFHHLELGNKKIQIVMNRNNAFSPQRVNISPADRINPNTIKRYQRETSFLNILPPALPYVFPFHIQG